MIEPIEFIEQLKQSDIYIEKIYMNGGCYQFYKILKLLYKKAKAYKVKTDYMSGCYDHIITKINNKYYDITGEVQINNYFGVDEVYNEDLVEVEHWSFAMFNWLYKSCPNCGEEIAG